MDLEVRHLKLVCAIADAGSMNKAALQLGLAQPALTAQLQRIERALGGLLFIRDRRGATPTPLGELVLARARLVLPAMKSLRDDVARMVGPEAEPGHYRVGAVRGPIIGGVMTRAAPHMRLTPHLFDSGRTVAENVRIGKLDFCLLGQCSNSDATRLSEKLVWKVIGIEAIQLLVSDKHALASRSEVRLGELAMAQWIGAPGGESCFRDCFIAACAREGFTPKTMYELDISGSVDLIRAEQAVGLCRSSFHAVTGLVTVPIAGTPLRWQHLLGWHPDTDGDVAAKLLQHATEAFQDATSRNPRVIPAPQHNSDAGESA